MESRIVTRPSRFQSLGPEVRFGQVKHGLSARTLSARVDYPHPSHFGRPQLPKYFAKSRSITDVRWHRGRRYNSCYVKSRSRIRPARLINLLKGRPVRNGYILSVLTAILVALPAFAQADSGHGPIPKEVANELGVLVGKWEASGRAAGSEFTGTW